MGQRSHKILNLTDHQGFKIKIKKYSYILRELAQVYYLSGCVWRVAYRDARIDGRDNSFFSGH